MTDDEWEAVKNGKIKDLKRTKEMMKLRYPREITLFDEFIDLWNYNFKFK